MLLVSLLCALLGISVAAKPVVQRHFNSTAWTSDYVLQPEEVIVFGEGRMEVVHESVYRQILFSQGLSHSVLDINDVPLESQTVPQDTSKIEHRDSCDLTTAVITDTTQSFVDWDVQMSPVVIGTGNGIDVSVSSGYSVSNGISVSAGLDLSLVKDKLGSSVGVDYTRTWTTQTVVTVKATVPDGYSGVMITKPIKTRKNGRVLRGCLGSQTQDGTFSADSFQDGSYAGVKWVSGAITMCAKKEFPLSRCSGNGNFI
ncbi:hypothetical protein N7452_006827 [Penicillium brevicompactum]|uniref:Uncharacterized protein n=1 Tax=Penicillium brevicompactum TaxID=5074 RepID=A0A9W9UH12_PENBR|nr:hypothetical protein N7452_006827 [Penicillium brevicompactum]